jgi:hypothetical protein
MCLHILSTMNLLKTFLIQQITYYFKFPLFIILLNIINQILAFSIAQEYYNKMKKINITNQL